MAEELVGEIVTESVLKHVGKHVRRSLLGDDRKKVIRAISIIDKMSKQLNEPLDIDVVVVNLEKEGFERKHILEAVRIAKKGGYLQIQLSWNRNVIIRLQHSATS